MKIGLLTAHASRRAAGVWVGVAQLGKALAERGLDVEIFGIADDGSATDAAGWDGPPLNLHAVRGSEAFGYAPRLSRTLQSRRPSLLHANGLWMYPSLASLRWSRRARIPRNRGERRTSPTSPRGPGLTCKRFASATGPVSSPPS